MSTKKKLLFTILSMKGSGGAERALTNRINYLIENYDYEVCIVTTKINDSSISYYPLNPKVEIKNIPIDFSKNSIIAKLKTIFPNSHQLEKPLLDFINEKRFDICTSFGSETFLYHEKSYQNFIKIKENRFTYKKLLTDEKLSLPKKLWRAIRFNESVAIQRRMDYIIALTEEDADFWRNYLKNVTVIPNFINLKEIQLSDLENKEIIAVGRLEKEKDFPSMIKAFRKVADFKPDWILNIFGEGSLKTELNQLIEQLNLKEQVFLKGSVKNIYEQYSRSSIYLMTSRYEGFPNTMLESMAHGLPVIAFESVGGVRVLVNDQENGFMITNRNIAQLADRITQLIENKSLRKEMGAKSQMIANEYSQESIMEKWHQFYSSI